MADTEKSTALKKAFADVILNSTKEAAGRIMQSEKKAFGYQHELLSVKEEALQMFKRLKQMLDSKVKESEMMSLNKQKKIEELEAQLGEAEDIVEELRMKLRGLYDELEKLTSSKIQTPDDQNFNEETGEVPLSSSFKDKNSLHTVEAVISSPHDKLVGSCDMKDLIFDENNNISPCSFKGNGSDCTRSLCEKNEAVISSPVFAHDKSVGSCDTKDLVFDGTGMSPCSFKCLNGYEKNEDNGNLHLLEKPDDGNGEAYIRAEVRKRDGNEVEVCAVGSSKRFKSESPSSFSDSDTCRVSGSSDIGLHPSSINDNVNSGEEDSRQISTQLEKDLGLRNSGDQKAETIETGVEAARTNVKEAAFSWVDKRCIKYTFKRKRRKESCISHNRDLLADGEKEKENIPFGDPKSGFHK